MDLLDSEILSKSLDIICTPTLKRNSNYHLSATWRIYRNEYWPIMPWLFLLVMYAAFIQIEKTQP